MYAKYKIEKLIADQAPIMAKELGLEGWVIQWHVCSSKTNYLKIRGMYKRNRDGKYGMTYMNDKLADIIIFYDNAHTEKGALSTIYHELLHVMMYELTQLLTIGADRGTRVEEKLVRRLEKIYRMRLK